MRKSGQAEVAVCSELPTNQFSLVAAGGRDAPKLLRELELGDDAMHDAAIGAENIWLNVHGESSQCGAGVGLAHTFQRRHNRRLDRKTFKC